MSEETIELLSFADLQGWEADDHAAALATFRNTCADLVGPDWQPLCALSQNTNDARRFFELFFRPVLIGGSAPALFTGYFEPQLDGARERSMRFRYPIYRTPPEALDGRWVTRREIEEGRLLEGRGFEIAWVDDPVELFFLQIQGSGADQVARWHNDPCRIWRQKRPALSFHRARVGATRHLCAASGLGAGDPQLGAPQSGRGARAALSQPILHLFPRSRFARS